MGGVEDRILFVVALLYGAAVILAVALYGATAYCALVSIRRLRRNLLDAGGYACLAGALVVPAGIILPIVIDDMRLASRATEIYSWRTVIPNPVPRNLIIYPNYIRADYALELAESGIFDVYVATSNNLRKAVLSDRPDCANIRREYVRFTEAMNFRRCAVLEKVDTIPEDGLVFFEDHAPLSLPRTMLDPERVRWAFQLVHRHDSQEDLIAYEENIRAITLRRLGILFFPGLENRRPRGDDEKHASRPPDPATFIYKSLGLDPDQIQP